MEEYYLESGEIWIPIWIELESGTLIREHPLKLNGDVDWDLVDREQVNPIPDDEDKNIIIYNEKRKLKKSAKGLGRNDKCFCGSNKKFKKCCLNKIKG